MNLSEMRRLLDGHGIRLTKSLGQNFLHDGNQLRRIVAAAELSFGDRVLEIGPGLGPLTEYLLESAGEVLAIEKDARLAKLLRARLAGRPRFRLLEADALVWLDSNRTSFAGWKLVANLPYSVASPILVELSIVEEPPERMVATLQLDVAQRLAARAGDNAYGLLTLLVQLRYEPRGLFRIPASCFYPEPEVDSACLTLDRRKTELLPRARHGDFVRLVKQAFSQRRKMMFKLLKEDWPTEALSDAFARVGLDGQVRAETVSLEQFVGLTGALTSVLGR